MMTLYKDISQISLSSVDDIVNNFRSSTPEEFFFKRYFFNTDNIIEYVDKTTEFFIGCHAFDDLIKLFPFLNTHILTLFSFLVVSEEFNFSDIIFLLEEEDTHNFEVKNLSSEWFVLLVDGFPLIFINRTFKNGYQKIIISSFYLLDKDLKNTNFSINFDDVSIDNLYKFTNYFCNNFLNKLKEYLELQEIEYVEY